MEERRKKDWKLFRGSDRKETTKKEILGLVKGRRKGRMGRNLQFKPCFMVIL